MRNKKEYEVHPCTDMVWRVSYTEINKFRPQLPGNDEGFKTKDEAIEALKKWVIFNAQPSSLFSFDEIKTNWELNRTKKG